MRFTSFLTLILASDRGCEQPKIDLDGMQLGRSMSSSARIWADDNDDNNLK